MAANVQFEPSLLNFCDAANVCYHDRANSAEFGLARPTYRFAPMTVAKTLAPKEMASWAKWRLIFTVFTRWVCLLAVIYVARTFWATSDTLDEVRNVNQIMRDGFTSKLTK
jgi:hypothetical protein